MYYTAGEFAKKAGITARMLRHYDRMELLKPAAYSSGGYRLYADEDLAVLQRIVALRYLGFSLDQIRSVLKMEKGQDIQKSLRQQKAVFLQEQERIRQIIQAMERIEEKPDFQWEELVELIQLMNTEEQVRRRFDESWRRNPGVDLHQKYSTNPDDWLKFLFRQMKVLEGQEILELDASDGVFWTANADWLPACHVTQTAPSERILAGVKQTMEQVFWPEGRRFSYELLPVGRTVLPEEAYDTIVANHLFIHGTELDSVLESCCRALKPGGDFYCTAIGHGHMKELMELTQQFDPAVHFYNMDCLSCFSMEEGGERLSRFFEDVTWRPYEDMIVTDDAQALFDYIWGTYSNVREVLAHKKAGLLRHFERAIDRDGVLRIHKEEGLFSARKRP